MLKDTRKCLYNVAKKFQKSFFHNKKRDMEEWVIVELRSDWLSNQRSTSSESSDQNRNHLENSDRNLQNVVLSRWIF